MNNKKVSNERLNNHKTKTNTMISETSQAIKALSQINNKYSSINNVSEIYRDKIYNIYNNFEKQSIDFWGNDFQLREAILFHLRLKSLESTVYLKIIIEKIVLSPNIIVTSRALNNLTYQRMEKTINEINKIGDYIVNYDLEKDLNETLIDYFENLPVEFEKPQSITKKYQKMKNNIEKLGLTSILEEKEEEILKLIEQKEEKCQKYEENKDNILKLLFELEDIEFEAKEKRHKKSPIKIRK
ncbi:MAG: hypothetical protein IJL74_04365 [Bacilli bacterium]|nr:hypothetical protein [Bacilli bacterium]